MLITELVINTLLGTVTRHPAGMHCPSWDDAFVSSLVLGLPRADYWVVIIDPLRFLSGWRKRRLNQALSDLSLSLGFLSVLYCCLVWPLFVFHWFVFCTCSVSWLLWFGRQVQVTEFKDSSPK